MTQISIGQDGILHIGLGNQAFHLQMTPDNSGTIPQNSGVITTTNQTQMHQFDSNGLEFYFNDEIIGRGCFQVWASGWKWQPTPVLNSPSGNFSVLNNIQASWNTTISGQNLTLNVQATNTGPDINLTGFAVEVDSLLPGVNVPPELSTTVQRTGQGWQRRYWLIGDGLGTIETFKAGTIINGSVTWPYGQNEPNVFDVGISGTRVFNLSELANIDLRPFLPNPSGYAWGYNMSAYALTATDQPTINSLSNLLPKLGITSLRAVHHDSPWNIASIATSGGAACYSNWINTWPGTWWIDMMHFLGGAPYKGTVWFDPTAWNNFLNQRQQVINLVGNNGRKVYGVIEINENDIEYHYRSVATNYGVLPANIDSTAKSLYAKALSLPLPATWNPKFRVATSFWGSMPSYADELGAPALGLDQHYYWPTEGMLRVDQGMDYFIGLGVNPSVPCSITEWGDTDQVNPLFDDSFMAPISVALNAVELGIEAAYVFAYSQNLLTTKAGPFELRLYPSFMLAMIPAALIFGRRETGFTKFHGGLSVDTGLTYGQVGKLQSNSRIQPIAPFNEGIVLKQTLPGSGHMVTVLGRCIPPNLLEKCSCIIDGITYNEGITLTN